MKLSYRGISYDYSPANSANAEVAQPGVDLKYRGATHRRGEVAKGDRLNAILKYRGAAYSTQSNPVAVAPVTRTVEDRARLLNLSHDRAIRNRQHSMLSRVAAQIGVSANLA